MHWTIAAPFTTDPRTDQWLVPFVPGSRHTFSLVPAPKIGSWHARNRYTANVEEWTNAFAQGASAWRGAHGGIITVFPHLAIPVGLHRRFCSGDKPVLAWCFNLGATYQGIKQRLARIALDRIDHFVVHSRAEVHRYSDWLGIAPERFSFVPLQRAAIAIEQKEEEARPFVLAMGSARRDYGTLVEAVRSLGYRTIIVAASHAVAGLSIPANVEVRSGLTLRECTVLAQRARVNVVPVDNQDTASGQVTILDAMRMGRPVVATRCMGSEDYVSHERSGLLVLPRDVDDLRNAVQRLWDDRKLRETLGKNAAEWSGENCSDEAIGRNLGRVLDNIEASLTIARGCRAV